VLFMDLPIFAQLHADLDHAAERWPGDSFLRHFRAPAWAVARQRAELMLADHVIVRGHYAQQTVASLRSATSTIEICSATFPPLLVAIDRSKSAPWLLPGPAAARSGFAIAAQAAHIAGRRLLAYRSDASEQRFADLPAVDWVSKQQSLPAIAGILAPSLCETYVQYQIPTLIRAIGSDKTEGITTTCALDPAVVAELL
jgi:hypothetical protein